MESGLEIGGVRAQSRAAIGWLVVSIAIILSIRFSVIQINPWLSIVKLDGPEFSGRQVYFTRLYGSGAGVGLTSGVGVGLSDGSGVG